MLFIDNNGTENIAITNGIINKKLGTHFKHVQDLFFDAFKDEIALKIS